MNNISVDGHWNNGGFLARAIVRFEIFPSLISQDRTKSQVFSVTREVLDSSQPRAIFSALELALKEMGLQVQMCGGEIVKRGELTTFEYNAKTGGRDVMQIPFSELSV